MTIPIVIVYMEHHNMLNFVDPALKASFKLDK